MKELVCIANIETGEVLRIDKERAFKDFIWQKDSDWLFTSKQVYKQYIDSLKPGSRTPKPMFKRYDDEGKIELMNVFIGYPSMRASRKKSSSNKKGKYYYQHIPAKLVVDGDKEVLKPARTVRHAKY